MCELEYNRIKMEGIKLIFMSNINLVKETNIYIQKLVPPSHYREE